MYLSTYLERYISNLTEDIKAVRAKYHNIDSDVFYKLIAADPTYNQATDSVGKYGKWILNLYNKNKLTTTDLGRVRDALIQFEAKRRNFDNTDINQFKSVDELITAVETVQEKPLTQKEIDKINTALRDAQSYDSPEVELIDENDDWAVYIPHSYAACMFLGKGTTWCTATKHSDEMYNYYKDKYGVEYRIFINKHNPSEKYQWHMPTCQFKDKNDHAVSLSKKWAILGEISHDFRTMLFNTEEQEQQEYLAYKAWAAYDVEEDKRTVYNLVIHTRDFYGPYTGQKQITPEFDDFIYDPSIFFEQSAPGTTFIGEAGAVKMRDILYAIYDKFNMQSMLVDDTIDLDAHEVTNQYILRALENGDLKLKSTGPRVLFKDYANRFIK